MKLLENKTGEITAGTYLLSIAISVQKIESGDLLIANNYILGTKWKNDSIYLFDTYN